MPAAGEYFEKELFKSAPQAKILQKKALFYEKIQNLIIFTTNPL